MRMEERCANMTLIPALIFSQTYTGDTLLDSTAVIAPCLLVDLMSNSRSEIDSELYYYHINEVSWFLGAYFFPMPYR
jgi:hypothetical protein